MEIYKIIIVGLIVLFGTGLGVVMYYAHRAGRARRADQDKIKLIESANETQQKLIYLLKSRSA